MVTEPYGLKPDDFPNSNLFVLNNYLDYSKKTSETYLANQNLKFEIRNIEMDVSTIYQVKTWNLLH